jgi:hypothetical protein
MYVMYWVKIEDTFPNASETRESSPSLVRDLNPK